MDRTIPEKISWEKIEMDGQEPGLKVGYAPEGGVFQEGRQRAFSFYKYKFGLLSRDKIPFILFAQIRLFGRRRIR